MQALCAVNDLEQHRAAAHPVIACEIGHPAEPVDLAGAAAIATAHAQPACFRPYRDPQ
jgi:hypothetical protein